MVFQEDFIGEILREGCRACEFFTCLSHALNLPLVLREGLEAEAFSLPMRNRGPRKSFVPGRAPQGPAQFQMVPLQAELCPPQSPFAEILTLSPS